MKLIGKVTFLAAILILVSCGRKDRNSDVNIIFLHHSTGEHIWGTKNNIIFKVARRINDNFADKLGKNALLPSMFKEYGKENEKQYRIVKKAFPKSKPYGWHNYPFDYYNIWVKNAGEDPYMEEPTLEILTKEYQVVIFKHCFPASNIAADESTADINSYNRTISNYKLQYSALQDKLHTFPDTKFILFTGATQVEAHTTEDQALRAREFHSWIINNWDLPDDNIYIWDLYKLQTENGLYFKHEFATSPDDSHPNKEFSENAALLLFNRIIDVIENNGSKTQLTGQKI